MQIADLVQVPLLAVLLHERELVHELMKDIDRHSKRLEETLAQQRSGIQLVVDGLPATGVYRLNLPEGKTVDLTIHIEEATL